MNTKRMMRWIIVLFLLAALPMMTVVMAQGQGSEGIRAFGSSSLNESEPNNTRQQANSIAFGDVMNGSLGFSGDNDYFSFHASDDSEAWIVVWSVDVEPNVAVCLQNAAGQALACNDDWSGWETDSRLAFVISPGDYYIRVYGVGTGAYRMTFEDRMLRVGDVVSGELWNDYYAELCTNDHIFLKVVDSGNVLLHINTWANTLVGNVDFQGQTYDLHGPGNDVLYFVGLAPGLYDIHFYGEFSRDLNRCYSYSVAASRPLLVSAAAANLGTGTVAGIPFRSEDILAYSKLNSGEERWVMFFDGSDVGVKTLTNVAKDSGDRILITTGGTQTLPGVGTVTPWDIIIFDPESYGENTAGTFRMGLDGSEHQLTTSGEKLDAIEGFTMGIESDPLYRGCFGFPVSTVNVATVNGPFGAMKQDDEDIFCKVYNPDYGGWQNWDWFFDVNGKFDAPASEPAPGNVAGLAGKLVHPILLDAAVETMYLTILGTGKIAGHKVTQKDIFAINYPSYTWGGYVWRGAQHGWNYNIDAIEFNGW